VAHYEALHDIAKALLLDRCGSAPDRFILNRAIAFTHSDRGFIVVREQDSFQEKYQVHFDRTKISAQKAKFSQTAVKKAIACKEILLIEGVSEDSSFFLQESLTALGPCSVLVTPLVSDDEVYAVIYMEKQDCGAPFNADSVNFMSAFSELAMAAFQRALEREDLARLKYIVEQDRHSDFNNAGIVGRHPSMIALLNKVEQVAPSNSTILIQGETGSGKEKIAEAIYLNSKRRDKPFVMMHCGALPETQFEAELFGQTSVTFSGAHGERFGRMAQAAGGILLLDEVAEIPLVSQAKLLHILQPDVLQRLSSDLDQRMDLRIVATTHRDLKEMVAKGSFREDLYYRLNVIELVVPPLRERKSDIPLLIGFFIERFRNSEQRPKLSSEVIKVLERYDYPGNVRELAHLVERLCTLARGPLIDVDLLPDYLPVSTKTSLRNPIFQFKTYSNDELKSARKVAGDQAMHQVESCYLEGLMTRYGQNISKAAEAAGMQRSYLHRLLARSKSPVSKSSHEP